MTARYLCRYKDTDGTVLHIFEDWRSLNYSNRVNDIGDAALSVRKSHPLVSDLKTDGILEVWRADAAAGLDWYKDWEGFLRRPEVDADASGDSIVPLAFRSFNYLLAGRVIGWYSQTAQAEKADVGETVMKEYVDENAGPGATTGAGRRAGGVTSGLSVEADGGGGGAWVGDRAYKSLLETLQEIGLATDMRFDIIGTGVAGGIQTFEFRTYEDYRGADRSTVGLVAATGLNAAGNVPVIFSLDRGNMRSFRYAEDRIGEVTSVLVLGQGEGSSRLVLEVVNATAETASPWNHREVARNANQESTLAALADVGDAELDKNARRVMFDFDTVRTESSVYGRDWTWGDRITARALNVDFHLEVVEASVNVQDGVETVTPRFGVLR